jgi:hypothetical protein
MENRGDGRAAAQGRGRGQGRGLGRGRPLLMRQSDPPNLTGGSLQSRFEIKCLKVSHFVVCLGLTVIVCNLIKMVTCQLLNVKRN